VWSVTDLDRRGLRPPGRAGLDALGEALRGWTLRHETLRSGFRWGGPGGSGDELRRFTLDADAVSLRREDVGEFTDAAALTGHLQDRFDTTADALRRPNLIYAAVVRDDSTSVYMAFDHSNVDACSIHRIPGEIHELYESAVAGGGPGPVPVSSYVDSRGIPGSGDWTRQKAYGLVRVSYGDQVCAWVTRLHEGLWFASRYPDTDIAHKNLRLYAERLRDVVTGTVALQASARPGGGRHSGRATGGAPEARERLPCPGDRPLAGTHRTWKTDVRLSQPTARRDRCPRRGFRRRTWLRSPTTPRCSNDWVRTSRTQCSIGPTSTASQSACCCRHGCHPERDTPAPCWSRWKPHRHLG
jgi:hypothetical protein